eukprot:jgi/Chlat1/360/Chrsp10S01482
MPPGGVHLGVGLAVAKWWCPRLPAAYTWRDGKAFKLGVMLGSILPDADLLVTCAVVAITKDESYIQKLHRSFSHSIPVILGCLLLVFACFRDWPKQLACQVCDSFRGVQTVPESPSSSLDSSIPAPLEERLKKDHSRLSRPMDCHSECSDGDAPDLVSEASEVRSTSDASDIEVTSQALSSPVRSRLLQSVFRRRGRHAPAQPNHREHWSLSSIQSNKPAEAFGLPREDIPVLALGCTIGMLIHVFQDLFYISPVAVLWPYPYMLGIPLFLNKDHISPLQIKLVVTVDFLIDMFFYVPVLYICFKRQFHPVGRKFLLAFVSLQAAICIAFLWHAFDPSVSHIDYVYWLHVPGIVFIAVLTAAPIVVRDAIYLLSHSCKSLVLKSC